MLFARAVLDKLLAMQAGPMLVAVWAQYQSLVDLVAGVTLVGLGQGLTVFAARNTHAFGALLRAGAIWGLSISALLGVIILLLLPTVTAWLGAGELLQASWVVLAVLAGWTAVLPGLFLAYWQGRQQRGRMVFVLMLLWLPLLAAGSGHFGMPGIAQLLKVQLFAQGTALLALVLVHWTSLWQGGTWRASPLPRYLWAGLSVGVLSPLSLLWLRGELAVNLSWEDVARLQALWRMTEWVTGSCASVLFLLYLPRLAEQHAAADFALQLRAVSHKVFRPALVVLILVFLIRVPLLTLLYDARFLMSWQAAALFVLGDAMRVAAWVPLLGLFARERVAAIALGEWLSLPLFASLVTFVQPANLENTGLLYVAAYFAYFLFNTVANRQ